MLVDEELKRVVWSRQKELALDSYDLEDGSNPDRQVRLSFLS